MKISQLKQIIREEIKHSLNEGGQGAQARSTAKELQKNLKDIRANGFDQDKYKKLITSIPAALADLANTLVNMPKNAPNGTEAEELATAIPILWDFSEIFSLFFIAPTSASIGDKIPKLSILEASL